MKLITNNPYRIIGLLVGATIREQDRQVKRLKQYIDAQQEPDDDFSFPSLGPLSRSIENVTEAASKLNLDNDKLNSALFWFYNGNSITDEPAFEALKDSNTQRAVEIWSKLISSDEITQRNSSAFHNLSTLLLCKSLNGSSINESHFEKGVALKLKFFDSDFFVDIKSKSTDETFKTTKKEIQLSFLRTLINEIEQYGGISSNKLIEILSDQSFAAKEEFLSSFIQKPIDEIEKIIDVCKKHRKGNKAEVIVAATNLYNASDPLLKTVKSVVGSSNIKYISISDKVAEEILQCGIQLFNDFKEHNTYDPGEPAMRLFHKAKLLAIGSIIKQRCLENTDNLQQWIDGKPERDRQRKIADDLQFISNKLKQFQNLSDTVSNARDLVDSCKPKLINIKAILGAFDEFYLKISSAVVNNAQGMLVTAVNEAQSGYKYYRSLRGLADPEFYIDSNGSFQIKSYKEVTLIELSEIVNSAYNVTTSMQSLDMVPQLKESFNKNRDALLTIKNQLNSSTRRVSSSTSSGGCYIATMAYGDYDHPQVLKLRNFRDNVLINSEFGVLFIRVYYFVSPKLVRLLRNQTMINSIIRKILNQLVKVIR
jgi:hypothetical protein